MKSRLWELMLGAVIGIGLGMAGTAMRGQAAPTEMQLMSKVVRLTSESGAGSCSGEQVKATSGESYILTAAHCLGLAGKDGNMQVIAEDGKRLARKVIAEDPASDLLLIEGLPGMEGMAIAKTNHRNQKVRTFTHGKALPTYKTEGVLIAEQDIRVLVEVIQDAESEARCNSRSKTSVEDVYFFRVCIMKVKEMATTAMIVPGSSGGMVVDSSGELVGVVSAGGDGMGWLVPLSDINNFLSNY